MGGKVDLQKLVLTCALFLLLIGCGGPSPKSTPTSALTPTPVPSPTPSPTPSPEEAVREGDELLWHSNFEAAWEAYDKAIAIDENYSPAYTGQSLIYLWRGVKASEVLVLAQKAVDLTPDSPYAQSVLGLAYLRGDNLKKAIEAAEIAVELDPNDPFAQAVLSMAYLEDNQFENARLPVEKAYTLDPESTMALFALGLYHQQTAEYARARESFLRATQLEPEFVGWEMALGRFWLSSQHYEDAIAAFERALDLDSDHLPAILNKAEVDIERKDYSVAQAQLDQALELAPDEEEVYIVQGYLFLEQDEYSQALEQFNHALELSPESFAARFGIGRAYLLDEECEQAELQFQNLISEFPNISIIHSNRGFAELCAGDIDKALPHFREATRVNPYSGDALASLGIGYMYQSRWEDAKDAYLKGLSIIQAPSYFHNHLGDYFWEQGDLEDAEVEYQQSVAINPYLTDGLANLSWLFLTTDRTDEARESIEKAITIDPEDQDLLSTQGYVYLLREEAQRAVQVLDGVLADDPEDAWSHLLLGLAFRDLGEYRQAKEEIETYLALVGDQIIDNEVQRLEVFVEALDQGYTLSEDKALTELDTYFELIFEIPLVSEVQELEEGRTLVVTSPLTQADLEEDAYFINMAIIIGLESLFAPRIDPPVENGLLIHLTYSGKEMFSAHSQLQALKQYADTLITSEELILQLEFNLPEDAIKDISIQRICREMSEVRELGISQTSPFQTLTQDELQDQLESSVDEDNQATLERDTAVLSMLGVIPPTLDLEEIWIDLYSEQIAGYYDTEDEIIYLVDIEKPSTSDQLVLAHECVHTVQDQSFDLDELGDPEYNDDQQLAIDALIEGDASLATRLYMEEFIPIVDQLDAASQAGSYESESLEAAPDIISGMATFPYFAGLDFVTKLYERDGWETVDQAFLNSPQSTEQILHPERYFDGDRPIEVQFPGLTNRLGTPWEERGSEILGEYGLQMILRDYFGPFGAKGAAEGWGGDRYLLLHNDTLDSEVLVLKFTFDDQDEADEFWVLFRAAMYHRDNYIETIDSLIGELPTRTWQSETDTILASQDEKDVVILIGPTQDLLEQILSELSQ